jgi:hypothetical protein
MLIPTAVAIQWVEVTTPKVPSISGLVVNGLGLILLIGFHLWLMPRGGRTSPQTRLPANRPNAMTCSFPCDHADTAA